MKIKFDRPTLLDAVGTAMYSVSSKNTIAAVEGILISCEGDTVTLSALKEKKLVGKNVGAVKILARGTLNKSLIIIAQDFSMAAIKMILLTGGQAIVTKTSGEQKEHRA